jgi:2-polyprenyl-3-methyl-5-hydroxy-6-metoxy-1,4-benzoquinol methylase
MDGYAVNYHFDQGFFDRVQFERCGLIRLEGWYSGYGLRGFEFPKCFIAGEEIPMFQVFRSYRPDVAAALKSDNFYHGLVLTYRFSEQLANKSIQLSFNSETFFDKEEGFEVNEPDYLHLLDAHEVLHREHIYGFGPPSPTVIDEVFELAKMLPPPILDFGCGSGALVKKLRDEGIEAYGIELDRAPIMHSLLPEAKGFIYLYQGGLPLPYKTGEFKSVFATEVIEHVADYENTLNEIVRIASRNVTITVPDISSIPVCHHNSVVPWHLLESTHVNFFTQTSLERLLSNHFSEIEFARICPVTTNGSRWFGSLVCMCRK